MPSATSSKKRAAAGPAPPKKKKAPAAPSTAADTTPTESTADNPGAAGSPPTDGGGGAGSDETSPPRPGRGAGFGVRSYLHHFYEAMTVRDPEQFDDIPASTGHRYLGTAPGAPGKRGSRCSGHLVWKVSLWLGVALLVFGVITILVGYLVPPRSVVVSVPGSAGGATTREVIDHHAQRFNYNLDMCKLVGLVAFCVGGSALAVSVLLPSFLSSGGGGAACVGTGGTEEPPFKVMVSETSPEELEPPRSPTDVQVPASLSAVKGVQPKRSAKEALMTCAEGEGSININEAAGSASAGR